MRILPCSKKSIISELTKRGCEVTVVPHNTKAERINDTGVYGKYGGKWKCWYYTDYHSGHGYLNVRGAIEKSCNYFFIETADRMGIDTLAKYAKYFGLGTKTGIELPGENSGTLASKEYVASVGKTWNPGDTLNASIGQGYNRFTPLQMTKYLSMIANGGKNIDVSIIKTIQKEDGTEVSKEEINNFVNQKLGLSNKPICMAKTQYSLSDNPKLLGKPKNFIVEINNVRVSNGAGFIVCEAGSIMTMPGLPRIPAANHMKIDKNGNIKGLF